MAEQHLALIQIDVYWLQKLKKLPKTRRKDWAKVPCQHFCDGKVDIQVDFENTAGGYFQDKSKLERVEEGG